ncbi:Biotinyl protein ligase (BPL) and lipoyl protein ligase (LPL), catalytic domain [Acididesulfobacillus acetoxydans]|uniref:Biotinyl protein ligase (BPL) and lipoyl protein ligase (LPL), catalytic domain n=1 Tax=Acididesulfobacillus acetoxydans TaxID=1561005 RepID=A0A8S0W555_9FIRM|nr:biotin/lipoate A/B protein ligase family protein [Acididesulfobacillus acetoxydans]CAA7602858.1 Biotinyl protein ligase (BPL) and lipoyl protein ligase (LPL), catalytic domain [Acididesulfobacillus acetoxydans]CEJ05739.1 Octanoyltransferase LipM [Acididesulfobacillus acetoxydans]
MNWRYLPFEVRTGAENMAIDEAILLTLTRSREPVPTLRFYGWEPAALSLGYAQSYAKEVAEEACREAGIDVVRRPTGGRAVLHQYELTYSVVAPEADEHVQGTVMESYLKISRALLAGFRTLGIPADMAHGDLAAAGSAACFDAPSWYELVVGGRKLVGSAQVRKDGILLQHGSIILHFDADLLFRVLRFPSEEVRQRVLAAFRRKACALDEVWPRPLSRAELEQALCDGFAEVMGVRFVTPGLSAAEQALAESLRSKYLGDAWTRRR